MPRNKARPGEKRAAQQTEQQQTELQQIDSDSEQRQTDGQAGNHQQQQPEQVSKSRALCGAATYRCTFKNEWTTKWPFITKGSLSTHYWCSVCRVENACCHQGVSDIIVRHVKSKGHQEKVRTTESTTTIDRFSVSAPSVGGMSDQEAKVCYVSWSCEGFCVIYLGVVIFPY